MRNATLILVPVFVGVSLLAGAARGQTTPASQPSVSGIPDDARYACPMETHPDERDPTRQGAYFSREEGKCPSCGMALKPLDELAWVQARRAAAGAEVAYTCPAHQHVFSKTEADCPRCGRKLEPFKVMYTCPDPPHAGQISAQPGTCPECRRNLTPYRGVWLAPEMAEHNVPPNPEAAGSAAYRCPVHPLVHSARPGKCPICAAELTPTAHAVSKARPPTVPPDARFVCPMRECWQFSTEPGECPKCGMKLKPIDAVEWAKAELIGARSLGVDAAFVCPMHPDQTSATRGTCPTCGMQLVAAEAVPKPANAPGVIAVQVDYLMEHYLGLQKRFASDSTKDVALHALGLVGAVDEILKHVDDPEAKLPPEFAAAARTLRATAIKTNGKDLDADRVTFVELGAAMRTLVEHVRPDKERYPKIYIFHCPMTKGDWLQSSEEMANPFYGFKMLKCGELQATK
ncbi:MAG TPA: heavy metal-binding domain-containing protein [Phycisphaerae bacterium]|nr:heavy metal-binding domain-containing protein [Phycisphaerae bacterium]